MNADFSEVDLGFVASLRTMREVLKGLKIEGCRWWISSDPEDAQDTGFVSVGHGYPRCIDRLNTLHFHLPVIRGDDSNIGKGGLTLIIHPSVITQAEPCLYLKNGRVLEAPIEDFISFYGPLQRALLARLQAGN